MAFTNLLSFTSFHVELAGELIEQLFLLIGILKIYIYGMSFYIVIF